MNADLFVCSFLVLFLELALIRWLPAQVRVIGYFPNVILIAAFLGLGVGSLRARRTSLFGFYPILLLVLASATWALGCVVFTQNTHSEFMYLLYYDLPSSAPMIGDVRPPIIALFVLVAAVFVPLGQFVSERLQEHGDRGQPLFGYILNLAGSLAGVAAFAIVSFLGLFPITWFAIAAIAALWLARYPFGRATSFAVALGTVLLIVGSAERADRYSPYYALRSVAEGRDRVVVLANGSYHQVAMPLARADRPSDDWKFPTRDGYHWAYDHYAGSSGSALVVGAGTGNDIAVLLDHGFEHVDAVEIDPEIIQIGRERHPDRPYDSPAVHVVSGDARSFLNDGRQTYDLIVFGTLDSMTRLSALSSVRLDTFAYTVESLRAARSHLGPRGGLALYFRVGQTHIDVRIRSMLAEAFGEVPFVLQGEYGLFNFVYLVGPAFESLGGEERRRAAPFFRRAGELLDLPTDDWPYLYVESRGLSPFYVSLVAILAAVSIIAVAIASRGLRSVEDPARTRRVDPTMFLFGFGFLLLETRSVTEMNLLWGATWLTSAVVFGAIITTILLATVAVDTVPLRLHPSFAGLIASLLAIYLLPIRILGSTHVAIKLLVAMLVVGLPIFFAGICFALIFRNRQSSGAAFGWNLIGAVAGGLTEICSMAIGLKALLLVATAAYLLAFLVQQRSPSDLQAQA